MGSGKGQSIGDPGIYEQLKREYLGDVRAEIAWRFGRGGKGKAEAGIEPS